MSFVQFTQAKEREPFGLQDDGHIYLICRQCDAHLVDIWLTESKKDFEWEATANCPFCGATSYKSEFKGLFHYAGFFVAKETDPEEVEASTNVVDCQMDGNQLTFVVEKENANARPKYR